MVGLGWNGLRVFSPVDLKLRKWIPLPMGTGFPRAVAVRPDGREAAGGMRDEPLFRMDCETGEIRAKAWIMACVRAIAYMGAEGRRAAVPADGPWVWETGGQASMPTSGVPREDCAGALSPDGRPGVVAKARGRGAPWRRHRGRRCRSPARGRLRSIPGGSMWPLRAGSRWSSCADRAGGPVGSSANPSVR